MSINLSFWKFVIHLDIAKSGLWKKDNTVYFIHIGSFSETFDNEVTGKTYRCTCKAYQFIILMFSLKVGMI